MLPLLWVGKKFFAFFSKISWNGRERSRIFHIRSIYRWYEYCSNDNKIIEMEVDLELEMKLSRRELRLLLLHEFRLGRKATEATSNICGTMGKDVLSIRTALIDSRMVTSNSMIYPIVEDHCRWIWIF